MPFHARDVINVIMTVEKTDEVFGIEAIRTVNIPLIPSIVFLIHKIKDHVDMHRASVNKDTKEAGVEEQVPSHCFLICHNLIQDYS
jgi:hypothetical protein